jgi:hypothetical protein
MLLRRRGNGAIAITQPGHSWLSGQLARAWGNDRFDRPTPFEAFCFAAEQHDIGWTDHDSLPVFDPKTGFPRTFVDVPATEHTALWSEGVRRALAFGRYPAMLISLHGKTIYDLTFDMASASSANAAAAREFLVAQEAFRMVVLQAMVDDPSLSEHAHADRIERNRLLLLAVDQLSLHACWAVHETVKIPHVPGRGDRRHTLWLRQSRAGDHLEMDPWPFADDRFEGHIEGRLMTRPSIDVAHFASEIADAMVVTIPIDIRPA